MNPSNKVPLSPKNDLFLKFKKKNVIKKMINNLIKNVFVYRKRIHNRINKE